MMKRIEYKIISPSKLSVYYDNKSVMISGEITITPVFYANINDFHYWNHPFNNLKVTDEEKREIVEFIMTDSCKEGRTRIIFD